MEDQKSTTSDLITTMEETNFTSGNTATSKWTSHRFYFTLFLIIIGVIGSLGNALILYALVASNQYKKYLLIFNQNALDFYASVLLIIMFSVKLSNIPRTYWYCTLIVTDLFHKFGIFGSVINLILVTVERYVKICTKKELRRWMIYSGMAFAWIASVVYNVADVFSTTVFVNGRCLSYAIFHNNFAKSFNFIFRFLAFYVITLVTFIFCYGRILIVIRRQAKVMASHNAPQSRNNQTHSKKIQTNVIKTMIIVSALYAILWLPIYIPTFLYLFQTTNKDRIQLIIMLYYVSLFCQCLYMFINPFIYATTFDPVRQILFRMIPWKRTSNQVTVSANNTADTCLATFRSGRNQVTD